MDYLVSNLLRSARPGWEGVSAAGGYKDDAETCHPVSSHLSSVCPPIVSHYDSCLHAWHETFLYGSVKQNDQGSSPRRGSKDQQQAVSATGSPRTLCPHWILYSSTEHGWKRVDGWD